MKKIGSILIIVLILFACAAESEARWYSAEMRRFLTEDPIGYAGGDVNFYAYVRNNPVNYSDPYGLFPDDGNWAGITLSNLPPGYMIQPILHPKKFLSRCEQLRLEGHRKYPNNSTMRHYDTSRRLTLEYGPEWTRLAGYGNEIQGFLFWDLRMTSSRLTGATNWAFSLDDLVANEMGIADALDFSLECPEICQ